MSSISPIIMFRAGKCELASSRRPYKVSPIEERGYIYLYLEDDLIHFCWRERNTSMDDPQLDLIMPPTDGRFVPYEPSDPSATPINGRIFVLKFTSSSQRYFFWLQSKAQGPRGAQDPNYFSPRDRAIGHIVDRLLQGEEVNVARELSASGRDEDRQGDGDTAMDDVDDRGDTNAPHGGSGGAGADATGGDVREEGEGAREGGADGARAAASEPPDAAAAVRNFLDSLRGRSAVNQGEGKLYPLLSDLLTPPTTVPMTWDASEEKIDELLNFLPPTVVVLSQQGVSADSTAEPTTDAVEAAKAAMSLSQKRSLIEKVLRSPQFQQSLTSLTMAIRDGGLPTMADALSIKVENGGYMPGSRMALGGGDAVEAFVEGVKKTVQEK